MRIQLIAVGRRMPAWVQTGFDDYARRMPHECRLELVELAPGARVSGDINRAIADEDKRMTAAIAGSGPAPEVIALSVDGKAWSTERLAENMRGWLADGRDRALLVGGPDGLGPASLARANSRWSLSTLTLPHPLVRVVLAEQLYRAHSILVGHPYHRA